MEAQFINENMRNGRGLFIEEYTNLINRSHTYGDIKQLLNDYNISKLVLIEIARALKDSYGSSFESKWRSPDSREGMIYNHPNLIEPRGLKSYDKSDGPEGGLYYNDAIEKWI